MENQNKNRLVYYFINSVYYKENVDEKRINTDEMVARIGSWQDNNIQMKCAREAVKLIKTYIDEGISFN